MLKNSSKRISDLTPGDISLVIQMAWEDRTTFETIWERVGVVEADVIRIMRTELTPSSFKMWRKRVKGRVTKHRSLRSPEMKYSDTAIADHRRANCWSLFLRGRYDWGFTLLRYRDLHYQCRGLLLVRTTVGRIENVLSPFGVSCFRGERIGPNKLKTIGWRYQPCLMVWSD